MGSALRGQNKIQEPAMGRESDTYDISGRKFKTETSELHKILVCSAAQNDINRPVCTNSSE